jgi:hypothetical protein
MTETAPLDGRHLLRHAVATLAYRGGKAIRDVPAGFGTFSVAEGSRTPGQILAHVCDLLDWVLTQAEGRQVWRDSQPGEWQTDVDRYFGALTALDAFLASDAPLGYPVTRLFQGGIADALTHVGQIAMLRRLAGSPVRGENYFQADIAIGRVGRDQPAPRREF